MATTIDFHVLFFTAEPTSANWSRIESGHLRLKGFEVDNNTRVADLCQWEEIARVRGSVDLGHEELWKLKEPKNLTLRGVHKLLSEHDYDIEKIADDFGSAQPLIEDVLGANWARAAGRTTFVLFLPVARAPREEEEEEVVEEEDDVALHMY